MITGKKNPDCEQILKSRTIEMMMAVLDARVGI
jgi:hypothetical protein